MTNDQVKFIHSLLAEGKDKWVDAANAILYVSQVEGQVAHYAEAKIIVRAFLQKLLDNDNYLLAATLLWGNTMFNVEPLFSRRVFAAIHNNNMILLQGAGSTSKCLGPDVPVRMFDGSVKRAQDVAIGDVLMGDDSKPRNVLQTSSGRSGLYRITPERGESWVCNDEHILSLRVNQDKKCGSGAISKKWRKGHIVDIPIKEYLSLSKDKKNRLKQFSVGYELPARPVEYDPYAYGAWIGDGGVGIPALHKPDCNMSKWWVNYFTSLGYRIHVGYKEKTCQMWCARWDNKGGTGNPFTAFIQKSANSETGEKWINDEYLRNSRENRLKLLAGLLDSDGCLSKNKTSFTLLTKWPKLATQICDLSKGLGFYAKVTPRECSIKSIGFTGTYYSVYISGNDVSVIPTLDKRGVAMEGHKEISNVGFFVESIGQGDYYGFTVDGNSRFLLGDCTVTHNSYSMGAWMILDWMRDPYYTSIKVVSRDEKHLKGNLFAHIYSLLRNAAIPLTDNDEENIVYREHDMFIGLREAGAAAGFQGEALKHSTSSSGDLKGYKPQPKRKIPHPKFGKMTRLRVCVDEGQNAPVGIFTDFQSVKSSLDGADLVKIVVAYNPESMNNRVVQEAEPPHGWLDSDLDTLYDWKSKKGWHVTRLDGARSENVVAKKKVYEGIQSYEGFMSFIQGDGADNSPDYYTFGRGFPPIKGSANTIIPPSWPVEARGEPVWLGKPTMGASVDLAFQGADTAQMTVFKWGLAKGWRRADGKYEDYLDRTSAGKKKPRHVLEIHQIIQMEKSYDSIQMSEEITGRCKMLGIAPEWVVVDKSGNGLGTFSHLTKYWGKVMGINWGDGATDLMVLSEDQEPASNRFQGISSEMWFAFREWLNPTVGAIVINPVVPTSPINVQLSSRRFRYAKNATMKVESKDEYKARNQRSCDEADSVIQCVQLVRTRGHVLPGMVEQTDSRQTSESSESVKQETADTEDSICGEGNGKDNLEL